MTGTRLAAPLVVLLVVLAGGGFAGDPEPARDCRTIHVVDHGYHTGLFIEADAFDPAASLGTDAFAGARWLEFGRGDAEYYRAADPSLAMAMKALVASESAVLHVVGLSAPPSEVYPRRAGLRLQVSAAGHGRLLRRLRAAFVTDAGGKAIAMGTSPTGRGRFFRGTGDYSLAYTCNHWMADLLIEAGVPVDPAGAALSSDLMAKLAKIDLRLCASAP